jgi:predicted deacetylase
VFIPPTWAVNKQTMDILENLGFSIVETEAEILILDKNTRLHTEVLNWDTGHRMSERIFLKMNRGSFREKVMNNVQMVRMAIHPRDPPDALADQVEMIEGLKNINYNFLSYRDIGRLFG